MASRVVFTTGDADTPAVVRLLQETGSTLLRKPFQQEQVAATCWAVVGQDSRPRV